MWETKKRFLKYINGKRQCRNNNSFLQDEDGHITNRDMDKAEVFNAFFASVFNIDQCPELEDQGSENDQLPINFEVVQDLLLQLNPYKSIGLDKIHPRILKELADTIPKPVLMIFDWSWESGEVPAD